MGIIRKLIIAVTFVVMTIVSYDASALQRIGVIGAANQTVTGTIGGKSEVMQLGNNIIFDQKITTDGNGTAQLLFIDKSALTVGPNSDLTIDKFVFNPADSTGELTLSGTKGAFRFVGGALSKKKPITFRTPVATIGIRGGIAIVDIDAATGATNATFVYGEEMIIQNKSGDIVRTTDRGYNVAVATPTTPPTVPKRVEAGFLAGKMQKLRGKPGTNAGAKTVPARDIFDKAKADEGDDSEGGTEKAEKEEDGRPAKKETAGREAGEDDNSEGRAEKADNGNGGDEGKKPATREEKIAKLRTIGGFGDNGDDGNGEGGGRETATTPPPPPTGDPTGGATETANSTNNADSSTAGLIPYASDLVGFRASVVADLVSPGITNNGVTGDALAVLNHCTTCNFAKWGVWDVNLRKPVPIGTNLSLTNNVAFIQGQPTENLGAVGSGVINYSGNMVGNVNDNGTLSMEKGNFTSTINIGAAQITDFSGNIAGAKFGFTGASHSIAGATFNDLTVGALTGDTKTITGGTISGALFGSHGQEMGGDFSATGTNFDAAGAYLGTKQ